MSERCFELALKLRSRRRIEHYCQYIVKYSKYLCLIQYRQRVFHHKLSIPCVARTPWINILNWQLDSNFNRSRSIHNYNSKSVIPSLSVVQSLFLAFNSLSVIRCRLGYVLQFRRAKSSLEFSNSYGFICCAVNSDIKTDTSNSKQTRTPNQR